jgi:hypothetical protein
MGTITLEPNPQSIEKARQVTAEDITGFWNKWVEKFPNGFSGMTSNSVMGKITQILVENPELFIILPLLKDLTGIVSDIALTASVISRFVNDPEQCICDTLQCLTEIGNQANFGRQAQYELFNEHQQALLALSNNTLLAGALNRQGFCLDDFGNGQNTLEFTQTIARELTEQSASLALGTCTESIPVGE